MPCAWRETASFYIACDTSRVGRGAATIARLCLSNGGCGATANQRRRSWIDTPPGTATVAAPPDNQRRNVRAEHDGDCDCEDDASCRDTVDKKDAPPWRQLIQGSQS